MSTATPERRLQRSANPIEALSRWLEASRQRAHVASIVLADGSGLLLAGAGPARDCDELAAWAPLLDRSHAEPPAAIQSVKLRGADAYVCASGVPAHARAAAELRDAAVGCDRILGFQ